MTAAPAAVGRRFRAIGMMSGTSLDGIDAAVIESDGVELFDRGPGLWQAYDPRLRQRLRQAIEIHTAPDWQAAAQKHHPFLLAVEQEIADAHAQVLTDLRAKIGDPRIDLVGFHGQTVLHRPNRGTGHGATRQIGDASRLAAAIKLPVVHDFRSQDVSLGGEGAPLVPVYHRALAKAAGLPRSGQTVAIINIGGVANLTAINGESLIAFDTGPGVALLDDWLLSHTGQSFDQDGQLAASGRVNRPAVERFLSHDYFSQPYPKSLDRNDFRAWVAAIMTLVPQVADGAATLTAMTAAGIARALSLLDPPPQELWLCGGGLHNRTLVTAITAACGLEARPVDALGWDGDFLEAEAFGFLAIRHWLGLPLSFPTTTGVPRPCLGGRIVPAAKE
ncbi:MAG: anhydro-N-acetylmuramic acid kinase [Alphaproteobacteria bacterium]|nr:anhydro-N-acetylmuramic acid kinase [Alphaproteobacteria bacterium]